MKSYWSGKEACAGQQDGYDSLTCRLQQQRLPGCAGVQCMDPYLRNQTLCREHFALWPAAQVPGCVAEAQSEEHSAAAEGAGFTVWQLR